MAICPDNSTECLLRALYDTQQDYNWDPLTFIFTVAIGILAFIIALVTVFQGVLGAGPGRLKASSGAIGQFARYSQSHISGHEFRVRTTAWVPYLDELRWIESKGHLYRLNWTPRYCLDGNGLPLTIENDNEQELAGGWVNLLSRVHARQEYFQNKDHARKGLISHNTDYLPSDIQAAPAIGTIETIVVLATLAGCENIDILDNFPVARSENLQLSFRDHPLLGLIAIFQQFPGYGAYSMKANPWDSFQMLEQFGNDLISPAGFVKIIVNLGYGEGGLHTVYNSQLFQTMKLLLLGQGNWFRALPTTRLNTLAAARRLSLLSPVWEGLDVPRIIAAFGKYCSSEGAKLYWHRTSRLWNVSTEFYATNYFSDRNSADGSFGPDSGHYVKSWGHATASVSRHLPYLFHGGVSEIGSDSAAIEKLLMPGKSHGDAEMDIDLVGKSLVLIPIAMSAAVSWLEDANLFRTLDARVKAQIRGAFRCQLHEIDYALAIINNSGSFYELTMLLKDVAFNDPTASNLNPKPDSPLPALNKKASASADEAVQNLVRNDGLRALLIYRAVVFGAFCSTAADSSSISGTELGRRIVYFI